jgi:hypothetical protein
MIAKYILSPVDEASTIYSPPFDSSSGTFAGAFGVGRASPKI